VGKPKAGYIRDGLADYAGRLNPHGGCALVHLRQAKAGKNRPPADIMSEEAGRILERVTARQAVWALDRRGQTWSSQRWARELERVRAEGGNLALVIGGAWGLDQSVLHRARAAVSLGPATLPHELAALVAMEQLYRAHTILAGSPYHRP